MEDWIHGAEIRSSTTLIPSSPRSLSSALFRPSSRNALRRRRRRATRGNKHAAVGRLSVNRAERSEVSGFVRFGRCGSYHRRELLGCLAIYTTSSQLPLSSTGRIHTPAHILLLIPCWLIHKRCVKVQRLWNLSTSYVFRPQRPVKSVPDRHSQFSSIFICLWHTRSILKLLSDVLIHV
jgi:hypothetical protein